MSLADACRDLHFSTLLRHNCYGSTLPFRVLQENRWVTLGYFELPAKQEPQSLPEVGGGWMPAGTPRVALERCPIPVWLWNKPAQVMREMYELQLLSNRLIHFAENRRAVYGTRVALEAINRLL